jgi:hypothetical protein
MTMRFYWLALGTLAVWRVTHLLSAEDGPWDLVAWLRRKAGTGFWANLLDCFYCLSLWIAAPFAFFLGSGIKERLCLWLAFSAGAIILNRASPDQPERPFYFEHAIEDHLTQDHSTQNHSTQNHLTQNHGGEDDALLRKSESASTESDLPSNG